MYLDNDIVFSILDRYTMREIVNISLYTKLNENNKLRTIYILSMHLMRNTGHFGGYLCLRRPESGHFANSNYV